jgi:hypothetical protein
LTEGKRIRKRIASGVKVKPSNWSKCKSQVLHSDSSSVVKNEMLIIKHQELLLEPQPSNENKGKDHSELLDYLDRFIQLRILLGRKRSSYKEFITVNNSLGLMSLGSHRAFKGFVLRV